MLRDPDQDVGRDSGEICRAALGAYGALFSRLQAFDPDSGFGEEYEAGARWLEWRAAAITWNVPGDRLGAAEALFSQVRDLPDLEVADWVYLFPRAFLSLIERRSMPIGSRAGSRRATDRWSPSARSVVSSAT